MSGSVAPGLRAALRLARGRTDGILLGGEAEAEIAATRRSFLAAGICLPIFAGLHVLDAITAQQRAAGDAELSWTDLAWTAAEGHGLAVAVLGFAIGWAGFALASHRVAGRLGRAALWPRFITLWNWCNLVQYLLLSVAAVIGLTALPWFLVQTAWLVALGWAIWLEWFMTRFALAMPGLLAVAMVALDLAIGMLVAGIVG